MPGNDLRFYGTTGSGGTADGDSQPTPANWLGRFRASQTLHEFQSTLTAAQTAQNRHFVVDSSRIGDGAQAHQFKWLLVQTGPAALSAARIESFDTSTGAFKLDRPTSGSAASGDDYAVFDRNNVWPDVTAQQALQGDERFRCVYFRNEHGAAVSAVRFYLVPLTMGGYEFARINQVNNLQPFLQRSDDVTDVLDALGQRDPAGGPDQFAGSSGWIRPNGRVNAFGEDASTPNNQGMAVWLRRTIPAGLRLRRSLAVMLVVDTTTTGSDPDPLRSACIMPFDVLGTPAASLQRDRYTHVGGGGRLEGAVVESATGLPIPSRPVKFQVAVGDVGSVATDDDPVAPYDTTDSAGLAAATATIPSGATPGDDSTFQMLVGAGDEVGDP